jgi:hypothetical protein
MAKIWAEKEITLDNLASHLADSGIVPTAVLDDTIWLRSATGIAYCIWILDEQKFVRIGAFLPLNKSHSIDKKRELAGRLNAEIFLPAFSLDYDDDLAISYVMPYTQGMIAGQFSAMVNRFSGLLKFIVESYNENGIIDFGNQKASTDGTSTELDVTSVLPDRDVLH